LKGDHVAVDRLHDAIVLGGCPLERRRGAHTTLGEGGISAHAFRPMDLGYCLVTNRPEQPCAEALAGSTSRSP
jgi:hypothetical protein